MRRRLALVLAGIMTVATLAGCGGTAPAGSGTASGGDGGAKAELNLIIASNQTSLDNPYSYGMDKFKEVLEEVSGGKISVTVHKGIYARNSVEQLPHQYVRRFFKQINQEEYRVKDELRQEVLFRQLNLMNPLPFKKPLHVVFIRNVMIYFDEPTKERLLNNIYEKMAPGGYLFIGSTESMSQNNTQFRYVRPSIYRK